MTKGAVFSMTLSVAKDYVTEGIRCNCICPARVHTPFVDSYLEQHYSDRKEEAFKELSDYQPMGRMGNLKKSRVSPPFCAARKLPLLPDPPTISMGSHQFEID